MKKKLYTEKVAILPKNQCKNEVYAYKKGILFTANYRWQAKRIDNDCDRYQTLWQVLTDIITKESFIDCLNGVFCIVDGREQIS